MSQAQDQQGSLNRNGNTMIGSSGFNYSYYGGNNGAYGYDDIDCEDDGSFIVVPVARDRESIAPEDRDKAILLSRSQILLEEQASTSTTATNNQLTENETNTDTGTNTMEQVTETETPGQAGVQVQQACEFDPSDITSLGNNPLDSNSMSFISNVSSANSVTSGLEEANDMVASLINDNKLLKVTVQEKNESIRKLLESYKELVKQTQDSDADIRTKHTQSTTIVENLKQQNTTFKAELEKKAEISGMLETQRSLLEQAKLENSELIIQLEQRALELLACKEQFSKETEKFSGCYGNLTSVKEELDKYKESVEKLDDELRVQTLENENLVAEIHRMKKDEINNAREEKEVYKSQMEVYKADFEEERRERVRLKEQRDQIAEEYAKLQVELDNKLSALEQLRQSHVNMAMEHIDNTRSMPDNLPSRKSSKGSFPLLTQSVSDAFGYVRREVFDVFGRDNSRRHSTSGPSSNDEFEFVPSAPRNNSAPAPEETEGLQPCPLCQKRFATDSALINHAANCCGANPFVF